MKTSHHLIVAACAAFLVAPALTKAQSGSENSTTTSASPAPAAAQPSEPEMMKMMMEMSKLNENHKLLAELVGDWTYVVKMWMAPGQPPLESKGTATRTAEMGGRYFIAHSTGQFQMPGADGKMQTVDFKGMSVDAYDNAKQKFVSSWIDSMGTGIVLSEGTYDAATKTFTYLSEYDMAPGMKMKARETLKVADKDHHVMEWFEKRGADDVKTMEISYTRKK